MDIQIINQFSMEDIPIHKLYTYREKGINTR